MTFRSEIAWYKDSETFMLNFSKRKVKMMQIIP